MIGLNSKLIQRIEAIGIVVILVATLFLGRVGNVSFAAETEENPGGEGQSKTVLTILDSDKEVMAAADVTITDEEGAFSQVYTTDEYGQITVTEFDTLDFTGGTEYTFYLKVTNDEYVMGEQTIVVNQDSGNQIEVQTSAKKIASIGTVYFQSQFLDDFMQPVIGLQVKLVGETYKQEYLMTASDAGYIIINDMVKDSYLVTLVNNEDYVIVGENRIENGDSWKQFTVKLKQEQTLFTWTEGIEEITCETFNLSETSYKTATGNAAGSTVTYRIKDDNQENPVASIDKNTGRITQIYQTGIITVEAQSSAVGEYKTTTIAYDLVIKKAEHAKLSFVNTPENPLVTEVSMMDQTKMFNVSGIQGDGELVFQVLPTDMGKEAGQAYFDAQNRLVPQKSGFIYIQATQKEGTLYEQASTIKQEIKLVKVNQTDFAFEQVGPLTIVSNVDNFKNIAKSEECNNTSITYSSSDTKIARVTSDGRITIKKPGKVTITAVGSGNEIYNQATTSYELRISLSSDRTFQFVANEWTTKVDKPLQLSVVKAQDAGAVTYSTSESSDKIIVNPDGTVIAKKVGTYQVAATMAATERYEEKTVYSTVKVEKGSLDNVKVVRDGTVIDNLNYISIVYEDTMKLGVLENSSTGAVSYEIVNPITYSHIDQVTGEITTITNIIDDQASDVDGNVVEQFDVKVTIAGDENYEEKSIILKITVTKAEQELVFEKEDSTFYRVCLEEFYNPAKENLLVPLPVTYSLENGSSDSCTIDETTGRVLAYSKCNVTVKATRKGNNFYKSGVATYQIEFGLAQQSIHFDKTLSSKLMYGVSFQNTLVVDRGNEAGESSYKVTKGEDYITVDSAGNILYRADKRIDPTKDIEFTIEGTKNGNDTYAGVTISYSGTIGFVTPPEQKDAFKLQGTRNDGTDWYKSAVEITPIEGYQITESNYLGNNESWKDKITIETEGVNTHTFYLKDKVTGAVTQAVTPFEVKIDTTPANWNDIRITYEYRWQDQLLEIISFGCYQAPVIVTIEAVDSESGISKIEYRETEGVHVGEYVSVDAKDIQMKEVDGKKIYYTSFTRQPQYKGTFGVRVMNGALEQTIKEDDKLIVLDTMSPEVQIDYSTPIRSEKTSDYTFHNIENKDLLLFYDGRVEATITIEEENFDKENTLIKVYEIQDNRRAPVEDVGINWTEQGKNHIAKFTLSMDGTYVVEVECKDRAGNVMNYKSTVENTAQKLTKYSSNYLVVDTSEPETQIKIEDSNKTQIYKQNKRVIFTVNEKYFNPKNVEVNITSKDINNTLINSTENDALVKTIEDKNSWNFSEESGLWICEVEFKLDAQYSVTFSYTDCAGNTSRNSEILKFTIDKMAPSYAKMKITYSNAIVESIVQKLTFGYYKAPVVVTLSAEDYISGIDTFRYCTVNLEDNNNTSDWTSIVLTGQSRSNASYSFKIPAQYKGKVKFEAVDNAGNVSNIREGDKILIVDSIAPTCQVSYTPVQVLDKFYFNDKIVANIQIKEKNFAKEDVKISIAKNNAAPKSYNPKTWKQEGDTLSSTINIAGDGEYMIKIEYTDRSGNQMKTYTSNKLVIDTSRPVIETSYNKSSIVGTKDGRNYYNKEQTVMIRIKDDNFRADDVVATVTAEDINGNKIKVADYANYLKTRSSWKKNGNVYEAKITYSVDANYTFDIGYQDLALNKANEHKQEKFTVDTKGPEKLEISYSQSVMDTMIQATSFGFYNAPVTVTISAYDEIAGVDGFSYSYIKDTGLNAASVQLLEQKLNEAKITYSSDKKQATAKFTIPRSQIGSIEQFRGTVEFVALDTSMNESELKDKKRIIVDTISPKMNVVYSEPKKIEGINHYYNGEVTATFRIVEANFYPEDVVIQCTKDGETSRVTNISWSQNRDEWIAVVTVSAPQNHSGDGVYNFSVQYKDRANNQMEEYQSEPIIVDTISPQLEVRGITDESANNDNVIGFEVIAQDENFDSFKPRLTALVKDAKGTFNQIEIPFGNPEVVEKEKAYRYMVKNLDADGVYHLTCKVVDKAGNVTSSVELQNESQSVYKKTYQEDESILTFSVNRQGSTFNFDQKTVSVMSNYFVQTVNSNITLEEINVDPLKEYDIFMNSNKLVRGTDYTVEELKGNGHSWCKYSYSIRASLFNEEGEYKIVVASKDKTGAVAYSDIKEAEIAFVVDRTSPEIVVAGLESGGRYKAEAKAVTVIPRDPGGKLKEIKVTQNSTRTILELTEKELEEELANNNEKLAFNIASGMDQSVTISCSDAAGNICSQTIDKVTISKDWYVLYYANKPVFWGTICGAVAFLITGIVVIVAVKRKRSNRGQEE